MDIQCVEFMNLIESIAPTNLAEDWDNVGLLIGSSKKKVSRILVCLDVTLNVVNEAIEKNIDLIISHHPVIFKGLKRILQDEISGNIIFKLIQNGINVYSAHTNFDFANSGLNDLLAQKLGLSDIQNLKNYKDEKLYKLVVFVPEENTEAVRSALANAGAGWIGNYSDCFFMTEGIGTFKPLEGTNPYIGTKDNLEHVNEIRLETIIPRNKLNICIDAILKSHPYEEAAYDIYPLELPKSTHGFGKVGTLEKPFDLSDFVKLVGTNLNATNIRVIGSIKHQIERVSVFCGSFDESLLDIASKKSDVLVTGDIKYHTALDAIQKGMCLIDAGHFNTEKIIVPHLVNLIRQNFNGIEVHASEQEHDPFNL